MNSAKVRFYLTLHEEKIVWIKEFLVHCKNTLTESFPIVRGNSKNEAKYYLDKVDTCIEVLSQTFPEWKDWFRCGEEENKTQTFLEEESSKENQQEPGETGNRGDRNKQGSNVCEFLNVDLTEADDDFMNVSKAKKPAVSTGEEKIQENGVDQNDFTQPD